MIYGGDYIGVLWFCPGPFLPFILVYLLLKKRMHITRCLFVASIISFITYFIFIAVPYYFQGYSRLDKPIPGNPLGWTALPVISGFAYVYTSPALGFLWLVIGMIQAVFGKILDRSTPDGIMRAILVLGFACLLFEFNKFHATINVVLE